MTLLRLYIFDYCFQFVLLSYILLLFDGLPVVLIVLGLLSHICYGSLLTTFPSITLLSPGFLGGTGIPAANVAPRRHRSGCSFRVLYIHSGEDVRNTAARWLLYCVPNALIHYNVLIYLFVIYTGLLLVAHYFAFQYFATEWHPFQEVVMCVPAVVLKYSSTLAIIKPPFGFWSKSDFDNKGHHWERCLKTSIMTQISAL